jgi:hypothetical protein
MLTRPWHGSVGDAGVVAVILSIANFRPLAGIGIHALVSAMAHVEALIEDVFPPDAKHSRVEWLTICVLLPRIDEGAMRLATADLLGRLRESDLEVEAGVWAEIRLAFGVATSATPAADRWGVVLAAAAAANQSLRSFPEEWIRSPIEPVSDYERPAYL